MKVDRETIGAAIGRIPSGCSILTAQHGGRSSGTLVSWVQQAAFDPLAVSVCVKKDRPILTLIDASRRFMLNIIGDNPAAMFKHFGKGVSLEEEAFAGVETEETDYGPALTACVAQLGCQILSRNSAGDHELLIAEVVVGDVVPGATPYVHLRKSGLSY